MRKYREDIEKYMYTMRDYMKVPKKVIINRDGYVISVDNNFIDPTPIEDYGEYYLSDKPIRNAFDLWSAKADNN